jgi:hypothetical protein
MGQVVGWGVKVEKDRVLKEKRKRERQNGISTDGSGNTFGGNGLVIPFRI